MNLNKYKSFIISEFLYSFCFFKKLGKQFLNYLITKGIRSHLIGGVVYKGYGFFFYENTKEKIMNNNYIQNRQVLVFLSASVAGVCAQLMSYPLDVIKKKMQAEQKNISQWGF